MHKTFNLANGLLATISQLNDESVRNVGFACRNLPNLQILPKDWRFWWVVSVKINEEFIHLVYPAQSYSLPERDLPLLLTRDIEVVEDALFLVYKDKAYLSGSYIAATLMLAVRNACSPEASILLSETGKNRRKKT